MLFAVSWKDIGRSVEVNAPKKLRISAAIVLFLVPESKFRHTTRLSEKLIQRREKRERQKRMDDLFSRGRHRIQQLRCVQIGFAPITLATVISELAFQGHVETVVARQKKMPLAIDFLPPGHMILCELFGVLRGRLDVVAQLILAPLTDLDDALRAPLVEKPVEVAQIGAVYLDRRERTPIGMNTAEHQRLFRHRAVVDRFLADDTRDEVADLRGAAPAL